MNDNDENGLCMSWHSTLHKTMIHFAKHRLHLSQISSVHLSLIQFIYSLLLCSSLQYLLFSFSQWRSLGTIQAPKPKTWPGDLGGEDSDAICLILVITCHNMHDTTTNKEHTVEHTCWYVLIMIIFLWNCQPFRVSPQTVPSTVLNWTEHKWTTLNSASRECWRTCENLPKRIAFLRPRYERTSTLLPVNEASRGSLLSAAGWTLQIFQQNAPSRDVTWRLQRHH